MMLAQGSRVIAFGLKDALLRVDFPWPTLTQTEDATAVRLGMPG